MFYFQSEALPLKRGFTVYKKKNCPLSPNEKELGRIRYAKLEKFNQLQTESFDANQYTNVNNVIEWFWAIDMKYVVPS